MNNIIYKPLPGFENLYKVGNDGTVIRLKGNIIVAKYSEYKLYRKGIKIIPKYIRIYVNNKLHIISLAKTVATLFVPNPNPKVYKYIDYIDNNRGNCRADNLIWVKHKTSTDNNKPINKLRIKITKENKPIWT